MQRIRTFTDIPFEVPIQSHKQFKYQQIAEEAKRLRALRMSYRAIGRALGVDYKVIIKALSH